MMESLNATQFHRKTKIFTITEHTTEVKVIKYFRNPTIVSCVTETVRSCTKIGRQTFPRQTHKKTRNKTV